MPDLAFHARQRALERYGITLDTTALRAIEARLAAGDGMVLRRSPLDGSEVRVIRVADQLVTVAFDTATRQVKTFLPDAGRRL